MIKEIEINSDYSSQKREVEELNNKLFLSSFTHDIEVKE